MLRKTVPDLYSGNWLKLGRRRLRVGYGEKTVHETKQNADVFEAPTRLFSTSLSNLVHWYVTVHPSARASICHKLVPCKDDKCLQDHVAFTTGSSGTLDFRDQLSDLGS